MTFDPNQPRDPAGTPTGGQWTETGSTAIASEAEILASVEYKAWEQSLTEDEKLTLNQYAGPDGKSEYLNRYLRDNDPDRIRVKSYDDKIALMDAALAKAIPPDRPVAVWRGINSNGLIQSLKPGVEFYDAGFVSSTLDRDHAMLFARGSPAEATVLVMRTTRGAYTSGVTGPRRIGGATVNEQEWILPRGLRYRVVSVDVGQMPAKHQRALNDRLRTITIEVLK